MSVFFLSLIFLSYKIVNEHVANQVLLQHVNFLEQSVLALEMSNGLLIRFFEVSGLIDENTISIIKESSLDVKETVSKSQFSD